MVSEGALAMEVASAGSNDKDAQVSAASAGIGPVVHEEA